MKYLCFYIYNWIEFYINGVDLYFIANICGRSEYECVSERVDLTHATHHTIFSIYVSTLYERYCVPPWYAQLYVRNFYIYIYIHIYTITLACNIGFIRLVLFYILPPTYPITSFTRPLRTHAPAYVDRNHRRRHHF